jgi:hypothetical protein
MTLDRRSFLTACSRAGITSALLPGVLYTLAAQSQQATPDHKDLPKITSEMIDQASALAGVGPFTADQKKLMLDGLNDQRSSYDPIRALKMANSVAPAFVFHPLPAATSQPAKIDASPYGDTVKGSAGSILYAVPSTPAHVEDLAFATVGAVGPW